MAALSLRPPSPSSSSPPPPAPSSSSLPPSPWPWLPSNATSPSPPRSPIPTDDLTNDEDAADDDHDHDHDHLKDNESPQRSTSIPAASEPPLPEPPLPALLGLSFNQDRGCFAAATGRGFRIYNCDPFREIFRRDLGEGGVALVEMLFRCNILALVGGGAHPRYPATKVMIWDDNQGACIGELSFRSEVRAVRLRRDRVVVVLDRSVFVYGLADLRLFHQIETVPNPRGLCAVSQQQGAMVLACPGGHKGQVRVEHYGARRARFIVAHDSRIACLALSQDGAFVATASTKGTLVRIFSSADGTLLQEDKFTGKTIGGGCEEHGVYCLSRTAFAAFATQVLASTGSPFQWHHRLGHLPIDHLRRILPHIPSTTALTCDACQLGKHHRASFSSSTSI